MSLSPWIFTILMDKIASYLRQRAISVFPYLDNWLKSDLIWDRLLCQTKYCLQVVQGPGFIPNLKVGIDTSSEYHVHRHGISDTTRFSQGPSRLSQSPNFDYQICYFLQSCIIMNFPFSFGQTQCSSRLFS